MSHFFASGGQSIGVSASTSVCPMKLGNIKGRRRRGRQRMRWSDGITDSMDMGLS